MVKGWSRKIAVAPATNFYHNDEEYILIAEIPGVRKEDIEVKIAENTIFLRAPREEISFSRCWVLTDEVEDEKSKAIFENGILTIKAPIVESKKARSIPVE